MKTFESTTISRKARPRIRRFTLSDPLCPLWLGSFPQPNSTIEVAATAKTIIPCHRASLLNQPRIEFIEELNPPWATEITMRSTIWSWTRLTLLAATVALAFGSLAWGQNYDYYHDEAREGGYRNGYRDGFHMGEYDRDRGHRFKFRNDDWEDSRGFEHWMGSKGRYKQAYRDGYENGYRRAYGDYGDRYRDRDRYRYDHERHDRDDWR